jgi:phenylalanyl-tRNA synthetase alpha chain
MASKTALGRLIHPLPRLILKNASCLHKLPPSDCSAHAVHSHDSCRVPAILNRLHMRSLSSGTTSCPTDLKVSCYEIADRRHQCDDWSNLTPTVTRLIGSGLHRRPDNALRLLTDGLHAHFHDYANFEFPDPVVSTEDNFDSLLIAPDHVSRSKSDTYYVNRKLLLRSHTSAHQAQCLNLLQPNQDRFVCVADVYRRDVIDSTHYPAFHQCELFRIFSADQVSLQMHFPH